MHKVQNARNENVLQQFYSSTQSFIWSSCVWPFSSHVVQTVTQCCDVRPVCSYLQCNGGEKGFHKKPNQNVALVLSLESWFGLDSNFSFWVQIQNFFVKPRKKQKWKDGESCSHRPSEFVLKICLQISQSHSVLLRHNAGALFKRHGGINTKKLAAVANGWEYLLFLLSAFSPVFHCWLPLEMELIHLWSMILLFPSPFIYFDMNKPSPWGTLLHVHLTLEVTDINLKMKLS